MNFITTVVSEKISDISEKNPTPSQRTQLFNQLKFVKPYKVYNNDTSGVDILGHFIE